MADLGQLTGVIKTFERPRCLARLVRSIRRFYPDLKLIVADDSFRPTPPPALGDIEYVRLPPDGGVSAGRNALVARVRTPYFAMLDDDFEFTRQTRLERLLDVVERSGLILAGGEYILRRRKIYGVRLTPQPYHGTIELDGDMVQFHRGWRAACDGYYRCDIVQQFFVARTAAVKQHGGWYAPLKTNDHDEFFLRLKKSGKEVAYCPDVTILHWNAKPRGYWRYRRRNHYHLAAARHGICKWVDMYGNLRIYTDEAATGGSEGLRRAA